MGKDVGIIRKWGVLLGLMKEANSNKWQEYNEFVNAMGSMIFLNMTLGTSPNDTSCC